MSYNKKDKKFKSFIKALKNYETYINTDKEKKDDKSVIKFKQVHKKFNEYFDYLYKTYIKLDDKRVKKLKSVMNYAMLGSGKRLRPFLIFLTYYFCKGLNYSIVNIFMLAIEMIHSFSLIHDDLPSIDNDELRRGKQSVWKKYGEDMAILAGDALYMFATSYLMENVKKNVKSKPAKAIIESSDILLRLAGIDGMLVGEVYDVLNTKNNKLTIDDIKYMYKKKTGALIVASIVIGAKLAMEKGKNLELFEKLSEKLGAAYQIKDDLLEKLSTTKKIGKSVSSDTKNGKVTFVDKVGIKKANEKLNNLKEESLKLINKLTNSRNKKESKVYKDVMLKIFCREK